MGRALRSLFIIALFMAEFICSAQTEVQVSDPAIEMVGNTLYITYDILNSTPQDQYIIEIVILDEQGEEINARALEGDIGEDVAGGSDKRIIWDLEADQIFLDEYISVQINAWLIEPPPPPFTLQEPPEEQGDQQQEPPDEVMEEEQADGGDTTREENKEAEEPDITLLTSTQDYSRRNVIIHSVVLPGLGLSRLTGKPHYIRGILGYACLVGSIGYNREAINVYEEIDKLAYFDEIQRAYDTSVRLDHISEILFYSAIGIWVTDIVWTILGTKDLKQLTSSADLRGFSIGSQFDDFSLTPMISVTYRF